MHMNLRTQLRWSGLGAVLIAATAVVAATPVSAAAGVPSSDVTTWTPQADTYVQSFAPTRANGTRRYLQADGDPDVRTYLRFVVAGAPRGPQHTVLRIRHATANPDPPFCDEPWECWHRTNVEVRAVAAGGWDESTTYRTAPAAGRVLGVSSQEAGRALFWAEIDLGDLIDGDGVYELAVTGSSTTNQTFASSESGNPPQLVILPALQ
jgi:hypothetical protein